MNEEPDATSFSQSSVDPSRELDLRIPYCTEGLPGIGGSIKSIASDFEVEEVAAYEPCGSGDQLFLWIEKRDTSAETLVRHLASTLKVSPGEIGVAGMKDRHAVTRQYISVPRSAETRLEYANSPEIRVLSSRPHTNKLRTGHLRGNRFRILIRDACPDAATIARPICEILVRRGFPNYFGTQRFGRDNETAVLGMKMLRGEDATVRGDWSRKRFLRKIALSAAQSVLFNRYLTQRFKDDLLDTVLDGDVMFKRSGGIFYVTERAAEQARFDSRETVHAGPIFGSRLFAAHGQAATREAQTLAESGIGLEQFRGFGRLLTGTRRANLVFLDDLSITPLPHALEFRFTLPSGSYATVLLREFMKN